MQYHEFIENVRAQPGPETDDAALAATKATLGTLGERITAGLRDDVASQLDENLAPLLTAYAGEGPGSVEDFDLQEFYRRVGERAGVPAQDAVMYARAVLTALRGALTPGQVDNMLAQLPDAYRELTDEYPAHDEESPGTPTESYDER